MNDSPQQRNIRIVCFLPRKIVGGVEQRVIRYANKFLKLGCELVLITLRAEEVEPEQELPLHRFAGETVEFQYSLLENQSHVVGRLARLVADQKGDIVWANGQKLALEAASRLPAPGLPLLCHLSGDSPYYFDLLATFAPVISSVVAFNRALAAKAAASLNANVPVEALPLGVEMPAEAGPKSVGPTIRLIYLGKIGARVKNAPAVIPLLEQLEERQVNYHLQMIGDGDARADLESRVQALGLTDKVEFTGYLENQQAHEALRQGHVILLFSRSEGCPNAVLEGMSHGMTPLVNQADWVDSVVHDGDNGFAYNFDDPDEGAAIIERLASDPDEFERLSRNAYETVARDFTLDHSAREYLRAFEAAIDAPAKTGAGRRVPLAYSRLDREYVPNWLTVGVRRCLRRLRAN